MLLNKRVSIALLMLVMAHHGPVAAQEAQSVPGLRPGDILQIRVWPDSTLSGSFPVEANGEVLLPFLGPIVVFGKGVAELRQELQDRYGEMMRMPVVSVTPQFRVNLLGGIASPGLYFVDPSHSLMDVISLAGGFRDNARLDKLRIVRGGQVFGVDAEAALKGETTVGAVRLQSGDRIVVPTRSFGARHVLIVLQSMSLIIGLINLIR